MTTKIETILQAVEDIVHNVICPANNITGKWEDKNDDGRRVS